MTKELYALVGVVLGAGIAALASWVLEVRRERSAARAARTLISIELVNALEAVYEVRRNSNWPIGWSRTWTTSWRLARERLLARPPDQTTLHSVASAAARLDQLENAVNERRPDEARDIGPKDRIFLWDIQQLLEQACAALKQSLPAKRPADPTDDEVESWRAAAA